MKLVFAASIVLSLASSTAFAQDAPQPAGAPAPPASLPPLPAKSPDRRFGVGTAFGAGFGVYNLANPGSPGEGDGVLPALMLPTFEFQAFLPNDFSIDVTTPLVNEIITSAVLGGFYFSADVFLNFNLGEGNIQAVLGPGIGFSFAATDDPLGSVRLPAEAGVEILTNNQAFGFKMMARPWVELIVDRRQDLLVGGGALALLGLSGFVTD